MSRLSQNVAVAILLIVGVITAFPVIAALNPDRLTSLYDVIIQDNIILLLARHRQVMLGLLGIALVCGAFISDLRMPVITAALVSKLAFLMLCLITPDLTQGIQRVIYFDVVSIVLLFIAAVVFWRSSPA